MKAGWHIDAVKTRGSPSHQSSGRLPWALGLMKSNRQRRDEINAHRVKKRDEQRKVAESRRITERIATTAKSQGLKVRELAAVSKRVHVNEANLAPNASWGWPDFVHRGYYVDQPFICVGCNVQQVWTATQQKWWYETAKGDIWTVAKHCRPCRRKERDRKNKARRVHLEGLAKKKERKVVA